MQFNILIPAQSKRREREREKEREKNVFVVDKSLTLKMEEEISYCC